MDNTPIEVDGDDLIVHKEHDQHGIVQQKGKCSVSITHIKDGQLLKLYPKLEAILPDLGITDWNKSKKKATRKKVKK